MIRKIKNFVRFTRTSVRKVLENQSIICQQLVEVNSCGQLGTLINAGGYLPFNKASLNFSTLAIISNDIIINNRKKILEFGSGISTVIFARLLKLNAVEGSRIISVEHDQNWIEVVKRILVSEELTQYVKFFHAPLTNNRDTLENNNWYEIEELRNYLIDNNLSIDLCIVDGPPAWYKEVQKSRYPALPFVVQFLNSNSALFLDDASREGERIILKEWEKYQLKRVDFTHYLSGLFKGDFYDISVP